MLPRRAPLIAVAGVAIGVAVIVGLGQFGSPRVGATPSPELVAPDRRMVGHQGATADAQLLARIPIVRLARVAVSSPIWDVVGGKVVLSGEGHPLTVEAGWQVAIFEGPVAGGGESWYRIYALPNPNGGPTDFFGWVPMHDGAGADTLAIEDPPICPDGRGISVLGALDPFTRARCIDRESVELTGWIWDRMLPTWYEITPGWMGAQNGEVDSTISINEDRRHPSVNGAGPFPFLELQVPPGLERPPLEFQVQVSAHVADPIGAQCLRVAGDLTDLPADNPQNGPLWCTTRLVVEWWVPLLGPEERPIDPLAPQLHRHPKAGPNSGCGGVGMPPLTFHMDAAALDPIWLEADGVPQSRIIPNFDPSFRVVVGAGLVIVDEQGHLVAREGTRVDPDGALAGHGICPTGRVVYFD